MAPMFFTPVFILLGLQLSGLSRVSIIIAQLHKAATKRDYSQNVALSSPSTCIFLFICVSHTLSDSLHTRKLLQYS